MTTSTPQTCTDPTTDDKPEKSNLFVDRVTIAGLQEAFNDSTATPKHVRHMFRFAILVASVAIVYYSYLIIVSYIYKGKVFDRQYIQGVQAPFPNITICGPETIRRDLIRQLARNYTKSDRILKKFNKTFEEQVEELVQYAAFNFQPRPETPFTLAAMKAANEMIMNTRNGYLGFIIEAHAKCWEMFGECMFGMVKFNCCDAVMQVPFDGAVCYQFVPRNIPNLNNDTTVSGGEVPDPRLISNSGLVIEAKINWPDAIYLNDLASDGFTVFIGPLLTPLSIPIAIPSHMDATIVLAPPKMIRELTGCLKDDQLPSSTYEGFYYDSYGSTCMVQYLANRLITDLGCAAPNKLYDNSSDICTPLQGLVLVKVAEGQMFEKGNARGLFNDISKSTNWEFMLVELGRSAVRACPPLCRRFIYDVISASYASIQHENESGWEDEKWNISWSRLRFFFPTSSYHLHEESYVAPGYMAICEIGGVMGVYLGLSMVTVIQMFAYAILHLMPKRRVAHSSAK